MKVYKAELASVSEGKGSPFSAPSSLHDTDVEGWHHVSCMYF